MLALEGDFEEAERETRTHPGINGGDLVKNIIVPDPPEDEEEEEECEAEKSESEGKKGQKSESEDQKEEQNQKRKFGEQLEPLGAKSEGQKSSGKAEAEDQNHVKPEPENQKKSEKVEKSELEEKRHQMSEVGRQRQESEAEGQKQPKTESEDQSKQKAEGQKIVDTQKGSEVEEKNNDIGSGKSEFTNQKSSEKSEYHQKLDKEEKNVGIKKPSGSRIEKYGPPKKHDENDTKMGSKTASSVQGHPTPMSHLRDGDEVPPPGPDPTYLPYSEMQQKLLIRDGDDEYPADDKTIAAKNPKGIRSMPADDWVLYNYTTSAETENQDKEKATNSSSSSFSHSDTNSSPSEPLQLFPPLNLELFRSAATPPAQVVQRQREERERVDNVYKLFSTKESVYDLIRRIQQAEARRLTVRQSIPDGTTEVETKNGPSNGK